MYIYVCQLPQRTFPLFYQSALTVHGSPVALGAARPLAPCGGPPAGRRLRARVCVLVCDKLSAEAAGSRRGASSRSLGLTRNKEHY